ncbi:hypothetical protein LJR267_010724 [Paraburkholderia hospita]|uniref:hypothetical protein n=1 Tax=Paraburkholderia hospita TaxID=169430 RepID=UPI003ECDF775
MELNQLVLCKQLYSEAEGFMSRKGSVALGLAISIAQDSVELFLRAVIKQLPSTGQKPPEEFVKCMDYIDASASEQRELRVPFRARIAELNKARVNFKHYGLIPSEADAIRLLGYVEQFFEVATPQFFSRDFSSISLSDLITSPEVRDRIKQAEAAEREGDTAEALGASAEAVELAAGALLARLQPDIPSHLPTRLERALGSDATWEFSRYMRSQLEAANRVSLTLALSLNLNELLRFNMIVPSVRRLVGGNFSRHQWQDRAKLGSTDAAFAIAFAQRYALAVDARMPSQKSSGSDDSVDPLSNF